jgi:hypothetical protein
MSASAGAAAAAAAVYQRMIQEEEEEMTKYSPEEVRGWEFKILRASGRGFGDKVLLKKTLAEEAQAGWEMLELFDNNRLRLRRPVTEREKDESREIDPYRMNVGTSAGWIIFLILFMMLIFIITIGLLASSIN